MTFSSNAEAGWDKFLNPDALKQNLLLGGIYLAAFEMLRESLIGRPRDFFWSGYSDGKDVINSDYEKKVLALHKHRYTASALWWRQNGAITAEEVAKLQEIREHRDQIAHNMPKMLGTVEHSINVDLLVSASELLFKIDNWWIQNVEEGINPEAYSHYTKEDMDSATSFSALFLSMMIPVALGDDSRLRELYSLWCEERKRRQG